MQEINLPYGNGSRVISLPDAIDLFILEPGDAPAVPDPENAVSGELAAWHEVLAYPGGEIPRSVAVAINDKTRPVPHRLLVPPLLTALESCGWSRHEITFVIAVGAHTPMPEQDFPLVLPSGIAEGCRIVSHDADDPTGLVDLGTTSRGTPCRMNRTFVEADLRIVVGNIEPHQFMGWSGGVKSASIGLTARETIAANHSMMASEGSGPCLFDENPVRQDVEEMGRMAGVHLALNVVLNRKKEIVTALAGPPGEVIRRGIAVGSAIFTAEFDEPADLVIVTPGGHPKDLNFYQAQKALRHGARAAAPKAPVIIVAACGEGVGSRRYEQWMNDKDTQQQVKECFEAEEFRLGHHKGMLIADDALGRDVYLVSDMPDQVVRNLLLLPASDVESITGALVEKGGVGRIAVLPYGNSTVPVRRMQD